MDDVTEIALNGVLSQKAKILFVDDEERVVRLLKMMFRNIYDVYTATGGSQALEIMAVHNIDVLVSDQRMPNMTGIELLASARTSSPDTVRILLTGYSDLVAIIGAVNEGEVYRFLNKPWNQQEITSVLAEAVRLAVAAHAPAPALVLAGRSVEQLQELEGPHLASAAKLLAIDGIVGHRHEIMEMFTEDYEVFGAGSLEEAEGFLEQHDIGVIVTNAVPDGSEMIARLARLREIKPSLTVVVLTDTAESDMVIKLINDAQIYRFAMKPIQPNVFRLAVHAAMKEHHRRLADPRLNRPSVSRPTQAPPIPGLVESIVDSLSRFTKIW